MNGTEFPPGTLPTLDLVAELPVAFDWRNNWAQVGAASFCFVLAAIVLAWITTRANRHHSTASLRLDWYLPVLRKSRPDRPDTQGIVYRYFRQILPSRFFSDRRTKSRGLVRRTLRWIGLTWLSTPVRRICQAFCLSTFLVLFCYACWPYDARPRSGWSQNDWRLSELEQSTGYIILERISPAPVPQHPRPGAILWLSELSKPGETQRSTYPLVLIEIQAKRLVLSPDGSPEPAPKLDRLFDRLLTGQDILWELSENSPNAWPDHYATNLQAKELAPAEFFLAIDPLVSISTAIASRSWVWSLASAGVLLFVCVVVPRGFCGYICPLGTTIDIFDWAVGSRVKQFRVPGEGWWVHIKYYLLAGILLAAVFGVLISGIFSAIPVITRASYMIIDPIQTGLFRGWHLIPTPNAGHVVSLVLFFCVLGLGFLRPRFWCKYVCPSGAVFSVFNIFRATERKVESSCIHCNKCVEVCPFDAIKPDFTTRGTDCTLCQTCAGVCPTHAIKFVERNNIVQLKVLNDPPTGETPIGRRGFLSVAAGAGAAIVGGTSAAMATKSLGASLGTDDPILPIRPPGSVPEKEFLEMCIRCGECFKVCPNNVLQVQGFRQGFEGLWTPFANPDWAGCESSCNACGQVCPTGAIRALPLEEKRHARMGLAVINESTCLPLAGKEDCDLCVVECQAAGYNAIEYQQVGTEIDSAGQPIEGTGFLAPVMIDEKCVGCGLCQTRCYGINVKQRHVLDESAIVVETGPENEDRLFQGSYKELWQIRNATETSSSGNAGQRTTLPQDTNLESEDSDQPGNSFGENPFGEDPFGIN